MAAFDVTMLAEPAERAVRLIALAQMQDAAVARDRMASGTEIEALHDFRVAIRRLRSWLRAHKAILGATISQKTQKRLRRIATSTNPSRDAEVMVAWLTEQRQRLSPRQRHGLAWLIERLMTAKRAADEEAQATIAEGFEKVRRTLSRRLETYEALVHLHEPVAPRSLAVVTGRLIAEHLELLRARLAAVESADSEVMAHDARIAGKRLRYLLEPVAPHVDGGTEAIKALKGLQDTLGDLHDAQVWTVAVTSALEEVVTNEARRRVRAVAQPAPAVAVAAAAPSAVRRRSRQRDPRAGLVAITVLIHDHGAAAFASLQRDWLGQAADPFFDRVEGIAHALTAHGNDELEIERKYLLSALPATLPAEEVREIDQGYLPGERLVERLRRARTGQRERYFRTVKVGTGVTRIELEEETTRELFEAMWPLTEGKRLRKRRHLVPDGELRWEIDEFTDRDLVLAEIELPSPDHMVPFPDWLAPYVVREVTDEAEYVNSKLAR